MPRLAQFPADGATRLPAAARAQAEKRAPSFREARAGAPASRARRASTMPRAGEDGEPGSASVGVGEDVVDGVAVLAAEAGDEVEPFFDGCEARRVVVRCESR